MTEYNNAINQACKTKGSLVAGNGGGTLIGITEGDAGKIFTSNGVNTLPTWEAAGSSGKLVQLVWNDINTVVDCSGLIPYDNTIPQISEGTEVVTAAITPTNASNYLIIDLVVTGNPDNNASNSTMALFQDATANALAAWFLTFATSESGRTWKGRYRMLAGTTSATTFRMRCGPDTASRHLYVNGSSGGNQRYNGVSMTSIKITEISA